MKLQIRRTAWWRKNMGSKQETRMSAYIYVDGIITHHSEPTFVQECKGKVH